jgi:hypothetical protein
MKITLPFKPNDIGMFTDGPFAGLFAAVESQTENEGYWRVAMLRGNMLHRITVTLKSFRLLETGKLPAVSAERAAIFKKFSVPFDVGMAWHAVLELSEDKEFLELGRKANVNTDDLMGSIETGRGYDEERQRCGNAIITSTFSSYKAMQSIVDRRTGAPAKWNGFFQETFDAFLPEYFTVQEGLNVKKFCEKILGVDGIAPVLAMVEQKYGKKAAEMIKELA